MSSKKKPCQHAEKYLFGLRETDARQNEKSYGPGEPYRTWLKKNPQYDYSKK